MNRLLYLFLIIVGAVVGVFAWQWRNSEPTASPILVGDRHASKSRLDLKMPELDPEKQQAIWESEHATFEIETHFGRRFLSAVSSLAADRVIDLFAADLRAKVLSVDADRTRTLGPLQESRANAATDPQVAVDRTGLADWLIACLKPIDNMERGKLRVLQIHPAADRKYEWEVELYWTSHGTTSSGKSIAIESHHRATIHYAAQEDLLQEATVRDWQVDSRTMVVSDNGLLQEVTNDVGLDKVDLPDNWNLPVDKQNLYNFQMAVEDYDRDGFLDIAIASGPAGMRPYLLKSDMGKGFRDVAAELGLTRWSGPSGLTSWIDYDNDGFPDLVLGDRLYHNERGHSFVDVTEASGLMLGFNPMGCAVADFDTDGLLDLYVIYQVTPDAPTGAVPWVGDHHSGALNQLWHNEGNGRFLDITSRAHADGGNRESLAVAALFYDGDHFPDLYIANDFGRNVLLRNLGNGTFEDVSEESGCSDFATSMGVSSGDLDNDGLAEIYVANMYSKMGRRIIAGVSAEDYPPGVFEQIQGSCAGNTLYHRSSLNEPFLEKSHLLEVNSVGWAFATAMADFNGDGWLDLYGATGYRSFDRGEPDG